ncbi:MAG: serine hydrolase domain-containing protein [Minwuia sp.]|uniref:serine hydrolase domain-containing protein n=1 Tax=Minwuia sp. TaxID=2493630 RepID=UPI003A8636EE
MARIPGLIAALLLLPLQALAGNGCFDNVDRRVQQLIANGAAPGIAVRIDHGGRIVHDSQIGRLTPDVADERPLPPDAIYRIYSMTKPITTAAAMILVEEDRIALEDPISKYLPEFDNMEVQELTGTVRAERPIRVIDLLRHTSGITYGFFGFGRVRFAYEAEDVGSSADTNAELVEKIAALPLEHQPGTVWEYSFSTDVLGRLIEVVSGQPLDLFLWERVFAPLGMTDTGFVIPEPQADRIAEPHGSLPDYTVDRPFKSGGGGLASTMEDYHRFTRMIRNGGELDGVRLLRPETVALMRRDHVFSAGLGKGKYYVPGPGHGFGLGFAVKTEDAFGALAGPPGTIYWGGYAGTTFWIDPVNDLIVIVMVQTTTERMLVRTAIRQAVYGIFKDDGTPGMNCGG